MIRGYLREPLTIVVRGISLMRALGRTEKQYQSVTEALHDFTSGAGKAVPTAVYQPPAKEVSPSVVDTDWRNFLRLTTVRERS